MHRCVPGVAILVLAALFPAIGQARTAMECIQHSEYKFRNLCSKDVIVRWCTSEPIEGYNHEQGTLCGATSSYYGHGMHLSPGASYSSFGWTGGIKWAACFSPRRPVATRGGERFVCRAPEWAGTTAAPAARPPPSPSKDDTAWFYERRCKQLAKRRGSDYEDYLRETCESSRHENLRRSACKVLEASRDFERKHCAGR